MLLRPPSVAARTCCSGSSNGSIIKVVNLKQGSGCGVIIYIVKRESLMKEEGEFLPSDSDTSCREGLHEPVCVLKHLPSPRELLCPTTTAYELYSPRCLYSQPLAQLPRSALPKADPKHGKPKAHRLLSIQDALFEHYKIKEQVRETNLKKDTSFTQNLWEAFNQRQLLYSRFDIGMKKNNFASTFIALAGVNLESKKGNFPQIKNKPLVTSGPIFFDSHFQSGNLLYAFRSNSEIGIDSYDLVLQNDVNTRGHNQWFYFRVSNSHKNQKVRFNIVNLTKKESLFSYGLKPLVFSEKGSRQGLGWHRNGIKVFYEENGLRRQHNNQPYYTLSFQYQFREALDTVYFAPSYPYPYTQLLHFLDGIHSNRQYQPFLSIKKLCESPAKNAVNLITISTGRRPAKQCKIVWIIGRQHPVQTTSSFMLEGIISYLLQLMEEAKKSERSFYDDYVFKIIPMVNPDGVIHGNTRAQLTGLDPNRTWKKPSKGMTPSVYHIKRLMLRNREQVSLVLDLHSHSKKLGCFFYGNYDPSDTASFRMLPSQVCQRDPRFNYKNCRFRGGNESSARKSLFRQMGIPNIFTVQCSLLGFVKENNRITEFKISDYLQMGRTILQTFLDLETQGRPLSNYPHQGQDFCDAQSARSDSCISQDEFPEVYKLLKPKQKVKESHKVQPSSNAHIQSHKYHTSEHPRNSHNSSVKLKDKPRSETIVPNNRSSTLQKSTLDKIEKSTLEKNLVLQKQPFRDAGSELKEENPLMRLKGKYNSRNIRLTAKKKANKTIKNQVECLQSPEDNKTFDEKSIQVEDLKVLSGNDPKLRDNKLMVIGSGVEEGLLLSKNEVGVQMDSSKENVREGQGRRGKEEREGWDRLARLDSRAVKLFRI